MALTPGSRLGPYQIVGLVGVGGMGEVYRARDTKLQRDVAIKILPEVFAADPERLARFEREAQVLASLNHGNVGAIYGFVQTGESPIGSGEAPRPALVLEFIEGPTLADRIEQGPIPVEDALPIARQIAEALETAHQHGIIHRDLKPANIKLRPDGVVKVLDFGLAKAMDDSGRGSRSEAAAIDQDLLSTRSPIRLSPAATRTGVLLGTAAYMSPEQARGKPVDKRSDIWAFGGVLFEMLAGRCAFSGDEVAELLASILRQEPNWTLLPPEVPPEIRRLLKRCLQKDPHDRLHDIADARVEIEEALDAPAVLPEIGISSSPRARWRQVAASVAAGVVLGAVAALLLSSRDQPPPAASVPGPVMSAALALPAEAPLALGTRIPEIGFDSPALSLSADGRRLAYIGQSSTGTMAYLRELDGSFTAAVPGTEGAIHAFFSPNGRSLGVLTNDKVKTVALDGGAPVTLCETRQPVSAAWMPDDTIILSEHQGQSLARIEVRGGGKSALATPPGEFVSPFLLPDGRSALTTRLNGVGGDYADVVLYSLDSGDSTVLVRGGFAGRYVPPGYLLFARAGSVFAARFGADRRQLVGEPVRVATGVTAESIFAQSHFDVSDNGMMAYVPGGERAISRLAWVDRQGRTEYIDAPPRMYGMVDLSDDGARLAVHVADVTDYIWLYDFRRREGRRITTDPAGWPLLNGDGTKVAFDTWQSYGQHRLIWQSVDGGSPTEISPPAPGRAAAASWSRDNRMLSTTRGFYTLHGDTFERSEGRAMVFSPDEQWGAQMGYAGGRRFEVLVVSIADPGVTRQFSVDGGVEPVWCPSGELFYRKGNQWLSSQVSTTPELSWDPPRVVFQTDFIDTHGRSYDVSPDGQRLLVVKRTEPDVTDRIEVITNWTSRLTAEPR